MLKNNKGMLIFGFSSEEEEKLKKVVSDNKFLEYKVVSNDMAKMKISDILQNLKIEIYKCELPSEKVILFNNFSDKEINDAISNIKRIFKPLPILAVITETSVNWTFEYLLEHLLEERAWHLENSK